MKKIISIVLLLATLAVPAFAASDMFFTLGVQNSKLNLNLSFKEGQQVNPNFEMQILGEFTSLFNRNYGVKALALIDVKKGGFQLGASFAYGDDISSNVSYILSVGPVFTLGSASLNENTSNKSGFTIGANIDAAFQFYLTGDLYVDVATGLLVDIVNINKGEAKSNIEMYIPLPRVGLGWKF